MARIAVLYCKRVKDHSCIACAKCFKAMAVGNGEYARHETIELVGMTDCGDCPGLVLPRVKLLDQVASSLDRSIDTIHLGTCVKLAIQTARCPIRLEELKPIIKKKFGADLILGTHDY